jgi:hypothetical protein
MHLRPKQALGLRHHSVSLVFHRNRLWEEAVPRPYAAIHMNGASSAKLRQETTEQFFSSPCGNVTQTKVHGAMLPRGTEVVEAAPESAQESAQRAAQHRKIRANAARRSV